MNLHRKRITVAGKLVSLGHEVALGTRDVEATLASPRIAISQELVVKVAQPQAAADAIVAHTEEAGGYFTERTDSGVVLKVPVDSTKNVLAFAEAQGTVVGRNYNAQDVGSQLDERRTLLRSREEVLQRYFKVLSGARAESVVSVEREMTDLVSEIESLKGGIQLMEHQLKFAEVRVSFAFRDRRPPLRDGSSSFSWLNSMNLVDLQSEFAHDAF